MLLNRFFNIMFRWCSVDAVMLMIGIAPSLAVKQVDAARINPAIVAARRKQSALLALKTFGRYSITAMSALDVALQSPDRMAGAVPIAGESGKQDVRLDHFLNRGEYKNRTYAPSKLKWLQSKESGSDLFFYRIRDIALGQFIQPKSRAELMMKGRCSMARGEGS